jgi:hypothetical protein
MTGSEVNDIVWAVYAIRMRDTAFALHPEGDFECGTGGTGTPAGWDTMRIGSSASPTARPQAVTGWSELQSSNRRSSRRRVREAGA